MNGCHHIYPIDIPDFFIKSDLDWLLIELPPRYLPMMPNGIGYVYNLLTAMGQHTQVLDLNIQIYHRFHSERLLNHDKSIVTASGYSMVSDPWATECTSEFGKPEVIDHFWPFFDSVLTWIEKHVPKVVGLSLNGDNTGIGHRFIKELRQRCPDVLVVIGGYICIYSTIGPHVMRDYDYMVIGEAEKSLPILVEALGKGMRPGNLPGIVSRWDSPNRSGVKSILPSDIDSFGFPKYEWCDLELYQTWDGHHLVPICGSRGCNWSRCRFCGECLPFRIRLPAKVVDEIEYFYRLGMRNFHFNESDVNGDPDNLYAICSEVIRRGLKVNLLGQLRIDRRNTAEYLTHLKKAGFRQLRFGVDGWNDKLLRLQRKGYNMKIVKKNLQNCHAAGIRTTVNIVLGVPGETDQDVNDIICNIIDLKKCIDAIESFNTLALMANSEYYNFPEKYKIYFRGVKNEIYAKHRNMIPPNLWYSIDPFIDQEVRIDRLNRIIEVLFKKGVQIGAFAERVIKNWQQLNFPEKSRPSCLRQKECKKPVEIRLVKEIGDYNIVYVDSRFLAIFKGLGPLDLMNEKVGNRVIWPYVVPGKDETEIRALIANRGNNPDHYYYHEYDSGFVGLYKKMIPKEAVGQDLLAWWELIPYIYSGNDLAELHFKLGLKKEHVDVQEKLT